MMLLQLKSFDSENELRVFSCQLTNLEQTFDFLSQLSGAGNQLIEASLIDGGHRMPLPTEAFDGKPFTAPLRQLEQEWQQVLERPLQGQLSNYRWFINQLEQQLVRHQAYNDRLRLALETTHMHRRRVQKSMYKAAIQSRLDQRYTSLLDWYERLLIQAQIREESLHRQLHQLQTCVNQVLIREQINN